MPARVSKVHPDGGVEVSVTCDVCGEPIIGANEWGMFCKNRCGVLGGKKLKAKADKLIMDFLKSVGELDGKV